MKQHITTHGEQLEYLKKIEGQIRGVQRMIEEQRYCIDIITQLRSIVGALHRTEDAIFKKHLQGCVAGALRGKSDVEKQRKIDEVVGLISKLRRTV